MGEGHRPQRAEAAFDADGDETGRGSEDLHHAQHHAGLADREVMAAEQPQHQQRLHGEAAAERVEAEQRGQPVHDALRRAERGRRRHLGCRLDLW